MASGDEKISLLKQVSEGVWTDLGPIGDRKNPDSTPDQAPEGRPSLAQRFKRWEKWN